jgi:3-phosphoglycerate kinase
LIALSLIWFETIVKKISQKNYFKIYSVYWKDHNLISRNSMLSIHEIENSTVLVRVAFDLPSLDDTARIDDAIPTIKLLLKNQNKVVLCTKWGRPNEKNSDFSTQKMLEILKARVKTKTKITFLNQFQDFEKIKQEIKAGEGIFLLENIYFDPAEKSKDPEIRLGLAQKYASLADFFVDEAFASSHRTEATNTELKLLLSWSYGLGYQNELENLNKLKTEVKKPFVVIMGGAKLETKLPLISKMLPKVDKILLGGLLSFTFLKATNGSIPEIYDSYVETEFLAIATELLQTYGSKIILPKDLIYKTENGKTTARDVGPETVKVFQNILSSAQTIFWNGTLGQYEDPDFNLATLALASYIADLNNSFRVLGGGDTASAIPKNLLKKFDFVSMGGGATLEYLSK